MTSVRVCKLLLKLSDWSGWRMVTFNTFKMLLQVQVYVDSLVKTAYDNWDKVVEYDGKTFLPGNGLDRQQPQFALPVTAPSEQQLNSGLPVGGKCYCCAKSCLMDRKHHPAFLFIFSYLR